ncbi:hypothetical protein HHK36_011790 [Tetracentron sinense]|uniref:Uncharacterized protein n=1 Tax=Tetracentron sinense TaxID=13715 RepID=A0A834ZH19_TETSI|nr:hypothetical protein HHK36_011790 [Tetracentron sinense]
MGYIYEAMDRAKETIKEAMGGQRYERRYKPIWNIIDRRWNVQLHQPLHAAGYILNPEFYYNNQDIEPCEEVMKRLYEVNERLIPDLDLSSSHLQRGGPSGSSRRMVEEEPPLASDETDDEELYIDADNDDSDVGDDDIENEALLNSLIDDE